MILYSSFRRPDPAHLKGKEQAVDFLIIGHPFTGRSDIVLRWTLALLQQIVLCYDVTITN